jgi:hypothetical protein
MDRIMSGGLKNGVKRGVGEIGWGLQKQTFGVGIRQRGLRIESRRDEGNEGKGEEI